MKRAVELILACCLAAVALSAAAAPPDYADLPANPMWLIHLDCDALRRTYLGKYILYQLDKPELNRNMAMFQSVFNFDIRTQLHGITWYGDGPTPKDYVTLVYAEFEPANFITLIKGSNGFEVTTNNEHVIYSWIDGKGNFDDRKYAEIEKTRAVTSKNRESVVAALAVIDGASPSLSTNKALPGLVAGGAAPFIEGTARNLDLLEPGTVTAVFKMCKRTTFQAGETNEQINAILALDAGDENTAKEIAAAGRGLIALLSLQKNQPQAAKLAGSLSIKQDGATVTAVLSAPSADLIAAIKARTEEKEPAQAATK